jgi:hypothetical protein
MARPVRKEASETDSIMSVRIDSALLNELRKIAKEEERSLAGQIKVFLKDAVENRKKK